MATWLVATVKIGDMTIQRMDNVGIVVDDLDAAVAFFTEIGMEPEGKRHVEGIWVDRTVDTLGLHRVMFAVDDIDDTVARLRAHGAELLGEVAQCERIYRLCYLRGPAGIIVALAERIG